MKGFEIAGRSTSSNEVGGDYFDYFHSRKEQESLKVIIGDVSGHRIDAALLMISAHTFIRTRTLLS